MASEIFKGVARKVWTDSQSAQAILCLEGGSWRTRHLRIRATAARLLQHLMGEKMFADIGTKPLAAARFNMLKEELGMKEWKEKIEEDAEQKKEEKKEGGDEKSSQVAKIIMIAALLDGVKAQEGEEEEPGTTEFQVMMVAFALLIVFATLAIQWLLGVFQQSSATKEISATKKQGGEKIKRKRRRQKAQKWKGQSHFQSQRVWVERHRRMKRWPDSPLVVMRRGLEENPRLRSRP